MFKVQSTHNSVIYTLVFVLVSMISGIVYAEGQQVIYVSDIIQGKKNTEREIKHYQNQSPYTYHNGSSQRQYTYAPPTQKIGSNPLTNPQNNSEFSLDHNVKTHISASGNIYYYPKSAQKVGSNPFIKNNSPFISSNEIDEYFASSCGCETSIYHGTVADN